MGTAVGTLSCGGVLCVRQADILVSELLGSFGDNELSPECLDGAVKFLKGSPVGTAFALCASPRH